MPRAQDCTAIELPVVLRDRLGRLKVHERQAYYEVVEDALDYYEDALAEERRRPSPAATATPVHPANPAVDSDAAK